MKNLKNLGKILNKNEQKAINGGFANVEGRCSEASDCPYLEVAFNQPICTNNGYCDYNGGSH